MALLQRIAEAVGTDVATFIALKDEACADTARDVQDHHRTVMLHRLVRIFQSLPDDASRVQALRMLEMLAAHANQPDEPPGERDGNELL